MSGTSVGDSIASIMHHLESDEYRERMERFAAEERERIARATPSAEEVRLGRCRELVARGVPAKDVARVVDDALDDTPAMGHVRAFLESSGVSLVLSGPRGCGKTVAIAWAAAQHVNPVVEWDAVGAGRFVDVARLARVSRYSDEAMAELESAALLAIDDLGMEYCDVKGSFLATLDGLFNARYAACRRTLIATNLPGAQFRERYGERIADRIRESGRFVELRGPSLRGGR